MANGRLLGNDRLAADEQTVTQTPLDHIDFAQHQLENRYKSKRARGHGSRLN
jgi:hypothetical protein